MNFLYKLVLLNIISLVNLGYSEKINVYYQDKLTIDIKITEYPKPIHFSNTDIISLNGNEEPAWLSVYLNKHKINELSYEEWRSLYSKKISEVIDISQERFEEAKDKFGKSFGFMQNSLLFDVIFTRGREKYYYAVIKSGILANSSKDVEFDSTSGLMFEWEDNAWKLSYTGEDHWLNPFLYNSLARLKAMIENKNVIIPRKQGDHAKYFEGNVKKYGY